MTPTTIYFDMDGTIADLYGVENWLASLRAYNPSPYIQAKPLIRLASLAIILNHLQRIGYRIGIISWLSKDSNAEYDEVVTSAKRRWLTKHLPSVHFDEMHFVAYGTPKQSVAAEPMGILFDDNADVRAEWTGHAFDVNNILEILKALSC